MLPYVLATALLSSVARLQGANLYADLWQVVGNFMSWDPTWNPNAWFLFPYILLTFVSPYLCRWVERGADRTTVVVAVAVYVAWYALTDWYEAWIRAHLVANIACEVACMILPFTIGCLLRKCHGAAWFDNALNKPWKVCATMLCLCVAKLHFPNFVAPLFAWLFVLLCLRLPISKPVGNTLALFGRHSMLMWIIHGWLYSTIMPRQLYSLRYPLLIYVALVTCSLALAWAVGKISLFVKKSTFR